LFGTNEISCVFKTKGTFSVPLSTGVDFGGVDLNQIINEIKLWRELEALEAVL
jgi:hypothetical protein